MTLQPDLSVNLPCRRDLLQNQMLLTRELNKSFQLEYLQLYPGSAISSPPACTRCSRPCAWP